MHSTDMDNGGAGEESNVADFDVPVLIIGGGPTGLLLAYMLSKLNVKSLVAEKYQQRLAAPKAHAISPRSLEICRQFGLDTAALRGLGTCRADARWVNFVTSLSGESIGRLPYERMDLDVLNDTPEMIHNIPQPDFESFVSAALANDPSTQVRKGLAYISSQPDGDIVYSVLEERQTKRRYRVRSKYVVGCDGAKSAVRSHLEIACDGEDSEEMMMTIHFKSDLRPVLGDKVGMLHWILDPKTSGFIIGYDLSGNQVLISNFDSKKHPVDTWTEDHCGGVVRAAIGRDHPFDILSWRPWVFGRKVAKQYRKGNVFLAGDAAHSFPPTGGLGLNTGLADVHNLAYKLAAVHHGRASDALLSTYEYDRKHIAEICAKQSDKNGRRIFGFLKMLGTAGIADEAKARANLLASIRDPDKQADIAQEVEGQREHFDNLELHIGYVYGSKATPPHASHYTPKFCPGARLPHAFIALRDSMDLRLPPLNLSYVDELSMGQLSEYKYSTLDLCRPDSFTLLVKDGLAWQGTLATAKAQLGESGVKMNTFVVGGDFDFVCKRAVQLFDQSTALGTGNGLLIRPDQHILARVEPGGDLGGIMLAHLGLEGGRQQRVIS